MNLQEEIFSTRNFSVLQRFRSEAKLCDVTLRCTDQQIPCHSVVLASQSHYFHRILTETDKPITEVQMPGEFRSYIIELVVGFLYSGSLILDQQNFLEVLQLHGLLDIVDFDGVVYRSLRKWIVPGNIAHFITAYQYFKKLPKLREFFDHVFLHSFSQIKEDLLGVGAELLTVISLLGRPELNVQSESEVHSFLTKWMYLNQYQLTGQDITEVLKLIWWNDLDLTYLSTTYFLESAPLKESQAELLMAAIKRKTRSTDQETVDKTAGDPPSRSGQYKRAIFSIASYEETHQWLLLRADVHQQQWFDLGECPLLDTEKAECCFLNGWLFVLGNKGDLLRYSPYVKVWEECRRLPYVLTRSHVVTSTSDMLFVVGGDHGSGRSVMRYDNESDTWHTCQPLPRFCDRISGTSIADTLYIVGQSSMEEVIVQHYNSITSGPWITLDEDSKGPFDVPISACADENMIYILGGQTPNETNPDEASILFRFNPSFENATVLHPPPTCCINGKVVAAGDLVYGVGGMEKGEVIDTINAYSPRSDTWETLSWKYPFHTKRYAVCKHA